MLQQRMKRYFATMGELPMKAKVTDRHGAPMTLDGFFAFFVETAQATHAAGNKLMFVGNGGSATIASHMAIDYSKNGGIRAFAFNDGAALTCLGNDLGYENVFAQQIELHARSGDLLIAISSSGNSENIVRTATTALGKGCTVVTLSGFSPDNRLRGLGDWNLYLPSSEYGFMEVTHLSICHAALDLAMGWGAERTELRQSA